MTTKNIDIREDGFGFVKSQVEGNPYEIVRRFTLINKSGASVRLITWGAGVQSIRVPNKHGALGDVALGFDNIDGYLQNRFIGRLTNRVSIGARRNSSLSQNNSDKAYYINDGIDGLDNVNWESYVLDKQVIMSYLQSQPGSSANMLIEVGYSWTDENELNVNIRATSTQALPVNLTSHCPMNLAGHGTGAKELRSHVVTINADEWISLSARHKASGVMRRNVLSTVFDLRNPTQLKNRLHVTPGGGYDHNLGVNSPSRWCYRFHGRVLHPDSGRFLELYSDQPGLQFSTENNLPDPDYEYLPDLESDMWGGCDEVSVEKPLRKNQPEPKVEIRGKDGISYRRHGGFVLSPQSIPARVLRPGKVFEHSMTYKFGVRDD